MARVKVMPVEPLEIEFQDGTIKTALFNNEAFAIFENEFGDLDQLANTEGADRPYDFCAKLLYCGFKVLDRNASLDESTMIIMSGGISLMGEVMSAIMDNLTSGFDEDIKVNFYREVAERINSLQA